MLVLPESQFFFNCFQMNSIIHIEYSSNNGVTQSMLYKLSPPASFEEMTSVQMQMEPLLADHP